MDWPVSDGIGEAKRVASYLWWMSRIVEGEYICPGSGRGDAILGVVVRDRTPGDCLGVVGRLDIFLEVRCALGR